MYSAFDSLFSRGYKHIVLIGSDSPDLPVDNIITAFRTLESHPDSLVLGPTEDGGYYLIGLGAPTQVPFEGINWGADTVLAETMVKSEGAGQDVRLMNSWYDIDTPEDFEKLRSNVEAPEEAPETWRVLHELECEMLKT